MEKSVENTSSFTAIILAAGQGKRMMSPLPKVLHPVAGVPMIQHLLNALQACDFAEVRAVVGHGEQLVRPYLENQGVVCCKQQQQLGTGDAVRSADVDSIEGSVLIANGDHPLLRAEHIRSFIQEFEDSKADVAVVSAELKNPKSFGRIIRHYENLKAIVEAKDASKETLSIREVNTGIYLVKASVLSEYLPLLQNNNAQKEFYLTDIISTCVESGLKVIAIRGPKEAAFGVNTQKELAQATKLMMRQKVNALMESGVLVIDPATTYVENTVSVGPGSVLYPGCYLRGTTKIGSFTVIEPHVFVLDSVIENSVQIRAGSYIEKSHVKAKAQIGPYARLRPETEIGEEAHIGNFVELKKTKFGARAKAGHLSYLGDAEIGEDTNIGCGTITCNYAVDKKKYKTKIGKNVFVGSDSQFIAPVQIGDDAVIGSGSTITKDVPANALAVARGKQFTKENYVKKQEK